MTLDDIRFPTQELKLWVIQNINAPGPWQYKSSLKEKLNCLLHFLLSGCSADALHIREYLCNDDPDAVWINSLQGVVLPYIQNLQYVSEVAHG